MNDTVLLCCQLSLPAGSCFELNLKAQGLCQSLWQGLIVYNDLCDKDVTYFWVHL